MNTESIAPASESTDTTVLQTLDFASGSQPKRLYRKIAKLPRNLRDLINTMLDDNIPAKDIIIKLNQTIDLPLPYPINEMDISRWKSSGYQRYIAHQEHLDYVDASREAALEMVATSDKMTLPEATLQVIASQCFEVLADFSPTAIKQKLAEDPLKYTSFLHVFARLTREIVHLEKCRDAKAKAAAAAQPAAAKSGQNDHSDLVAHADRLFRLSRPRFGEPRTKPRPEPPEEKPKPAVPAGDPVSTESEAIRAMAEVELPRATTATILAEHCLECRSPLPAVPPNSPRRPEDNCQNCGVRLPDIGLCTQPGFDRCFSCGTMQPHLLPNGERPRPHCNKCGERLHNPEPPSP